MLFVVSSFFFVVLSFYLFFLYVVSWVLFLYVLNNNSITISSIPIITSNIWSRLLVLYRILCTSENTQLDHYTFLFFCCLPPIIFVHTDQRNVLITLRMKSKVLFYISAFRKRTKALSCFLKFNFSRFLCHGHSHTTYQHQCK